MPAAAAGLALNICVFVFTYWCSFTWDSVSLKCALLSPMHAPSPLLAASHVGDVFKFVDEKATNRIQAKLSTSRPAHPPTLSRFHSRSRKYKTRCRRASLLCCCPPDELNALPTGRHVDLVKETMCVTAASRECSGQASPLVRYNKTQKTQSLLCGSIAQIMPHPLCFPLESVCIT